MKRSIKFLLPTVALIPTVTLASCSATQVSQYGYNAIVTSDYADENVDMKKTFTGFKFNNENLLSVKLVDENDYSKIGWSNILFPLLSASEAIINLFIVNNSFDSNNSVIENSDSAILHEFLLASKNVLNQGRTNQIKFGVTQVKTSFKDSTPTQPATPSNNGKTGEMSTTPSTQTNSVYARENTDLTVGTKENEEKKIAYYDSFLTFTFSMEFGYWSSSVNDPNQQLLSIDTVKNYVVENKAWDEGVVPKHDKFVLDFKYNMKIRATYFNIEDSFKSSETNKPASTKAGTDGENNQTSDKKVKLSATDFKNVKPILSINSFEKQNGTSDSTLPTLTEEDLKKDTENISKLLSQNLINRDELKKLSDKYKNFLKLSIPTTTPTTPQTKI